MKSEQRDILTNMGVALLLVQTAEHAIQVCLTFVLPREGQVTLEAIEAQKSDLRRRTLGYFLNEIRTRADLDENFDGVLSDFLEKRNSRALETAYSLAINAYGSEQELDRLAKKTQITFNKASDLHHIAMKIVTCKFEVDKRRVSECAAALRYLYSKGCRPNEVSAKIQEYGGTKTRRDLSRSYAK